MTNSGETEVTNKAPAIHIDRRHQANPKETDGDKAVRLAAAEIDEGKWKLSAAAAAEMNEMPGIALRDGPTPNVVPWNQGDFDRTDASLVLGEHPRVQEALARMEQEKARATKTARSTRSWRR